VGFAAGERAAVGGQRLPAVPGGLHGEGVDALTGVHTEGQIIQPGLVRSWSPPVSAGDCSTTR
jgi:hypothetical protein